MCTGNWYQLILHHHFGFWFFQWKCTLDDIVTSNDSTLITYYLEINDTDTRNNGQYWLISIINTVINASLIINIKQFDRSSGQTEAVCYFFHYRKPPIHAPAPRSKHSLTLIQNNAHKLRRFLSLHTFIHNNSSINLSW